MARLSLNDDDARVRRWLIEQAKALDCAVKVDQMGNIFCVRPGKTNDKLPVMIGSHLDTQPTGGRYDGILGVMAGLEVLRTLHDSDYQTEGPVGIVNWTKFVPLPLLYHMGETCLTQSYSEEGARFPIVTVSSGVWAGSIPLETAWATKEVPTLMINPSSSPRTMKQELERIGFLGDTPASHEANPIDAHFELHIEQGPILEDEEQKIGVVTGAQGYNWYEVTVRGRDSHAGTTPLSARRDALLGAAKMIAASNSVARELGGLITTGIFRAEPGSVNTMAHTVRFTLDIRHPSNEKLAEMVARCRDVFDRIAKEDCERGVQVEWATLTENVAVEFHQDCIAAIEESAEEVCGALPGAEKKKLWRHMTSGAGHDSCHVSKRAPTAMIFTPTRNGMSHTPDEYCSPEDCVLGAQVLLGAVLRYDAARK